ncbi:MAG TPA: hypothetical protein VGT05_03380, partial [Patescibacteria group bacterium]|nr:hypothetical protein [Patescibacteria group bacterium]
IGCSINSEIKRCIVARSSGLYRIRVMYNDLAPSSSLRLSIIHRSFLSGFLRVRNAVKDMYRKIN